MRIRIGGALLLLVLATGTALAQSAPAHQPLLMAGKTTMFQRVITRPGATLSPAAAASPPGQPVPGSSVFYVYGRQGGDDGWVQVGPAADGQVAGWMLAS